MKNNWPKYIPTILIAVAALALLTVMVQLLSGRQSVAATAGPAWVESNVQALQSTLAVSTNPTEQAFIQGKLDQLRRIQSNALQGQENAPEKPDDGCALRPTPLPTAERISGIDQFESEFFEQFNAFFNSRWQGEVNGQWMTVLAGSAKDDRQQGMLWVAAENTDDRSPFLAPQPGGALQIQSADGTRLTLTDESGDEVVFDVAARAFLTSPDEVLPTAEPMPTHTPTPAICPP